MKTKNIVVPKNATIIIVVDAPEVSLAPDDKAGDLLLHFFRALGWNGADILDPCKIRTTQEVYDRLYDKIYEQCPDPVSVGMFMVNSGPGTENYIPAGKVYLLEGWITPAPKEGDVFEN
jgi:hypothetical protein